MDLENKGLMAGGSYSSESDLRVTQDVDIAQIESSVLSRLVEEVRNNQPSTIRAFDRIHNRHNR